jgi:hypothetical protein
MKYVILDISELNNIKYNELSNHSVESVRTSLSGSKFIIKYNVKPSFIINEVEYTHSEILDIISGDDWCKNIEE